MRRPLEVQAAHGAAPARQRLVDLGDGTHEAGGRQFSRAEQPTEEAAWSSQPLALHDCRPASGVGETVSIGHGGCQAQALPMKASICAGTRAHVLPMAPGACHATVSSSARDKAQRGDQRSSFAAPGAVEPQQVRFVRLRPPTSVPRGAGQPCAKLVDDPAHRARVAFGRAEVPGRREGLALLGAAARPAAGSRTAAPAHAARAASRRGAGRRRCGPDRCARKKSGSSRSAAQSPPPMTLPARAVATPTARPRRRTTRDRRRSPVRRRPCCWSTDRGRPARRSRGSPRPIRGSRSTCRW